jgi:hypothetical protein
MFAEEDTEAGWRQTAGDTCERKWRMKPKRLTEYRGWTVSGLTVDRGWTDRMTVDRGWKVVVTAGRGWEERLNLGSDHLRLTAVEAAVPRPPAGRY